ncbi:hypothetical protein H0H87_010092 [Tephrocybe sp. NHM501043]|nr:hypothetical protein H0H87_010092 [Tephrocybe sp. NHM501043]
MQLVSWHVLALINALPLLLHVALLLFFAGIVVLLWSVNRATTLATLLIVACAYIFYFGSIFLPVIYPDCPYQHPISEHIRKRLNIYRSLFIATDGSDASHLEEDEEENEDLLLIERRSIVVAPDDKLDASALIWLLNSSTDKAVISAALQAIAGLPRDFSTIHILRDAGVIKLIEQGFQSCFDKDTTIDLKWHLVDDQGAWLYCKAWMNMTRGTRKQWPLHLLDPLWKLQDLKDHPDGAAIASCAVALSSVDSHLAQWELLAYLSRYVSGQVQLSHCTVTWILDSMIDGLAQWVMPTAVIEKTTIRAVPVLLRLLKHIEDLPTSSMRSAAGLALYIFTCGSVNISEYRSEERRRNTHSTVMLKALTTIVSAPEQFAVGEFLNIAAKELCRLASPMVTQSHRFSTDLKEAARASLLSLLISERIAPDIVPDTSFADVLHLLNQSRVPQSHRPAFVKVLVKALLACTHQDVASWSVRLLRPLLTECSLDVAQAFTANSGIHAVLRAAKIGDIDNRRLQVDSWRCFCVLVDSSILLYHTQDSEPGTGRIVDEIFRSDFFETVCAATTNRKWWLFEVSGHWLITFVNLCKIRPHERAWTKLINVIRDTNEKGKEHEGMSEILYQLENILYKGAEHLSGKVEKSALGESTTDDEIDTRSDATPILAFRRSDDKTSGWFEIDGQN